MTFGDFLVEDAIIYDVIESSAGRGVLEGAFSVLSALGELEQAGLTALATASGLPKATAHRLLDQLLAVGAVERVGGEYRIGPTMFQLGLHWQPHPRLIESCTGPVHEFARTSGATILVSVLRFGQPMTVCVAPGEIGVDLPMRAGAILPWASAAGRLLLANSSPPVRIPRGNPMSWARHAAEIRARGMAFDREHILPGMWCVAVPVRHPSGEVIAALSATVAPGSPLPAIGDALHRVSQVIAANLVGRSTRVAS
ncbi:MAG TPA: helix-turn-helix domain-containing protein [Pseudonocardiaceae bacterium]|nr:helix-turn-helix domain-containing protein [Pseudonocardiaceae bacterium]